jgi:hypothetical protein
MLGAHVSMVQGLGLFVRQGQDFLDARRVGDVAHHFLVGPGANLLLHLHPDRVQLDVHFLEDVDGHALTQADQAEQQMLGTDEVVIEAVGFLARQGQDLLRSRSKIVHRFVAHMNRR